MRSGRAVAGAVAVGVAAGSITAAITRSRRRASDQQARLAPFYEPPADLPSAPGAVIRAEPLAVTVDGGTGQRLLYVTELPDGRPATASAMVFVPAGAPPAEGRPLVAWAHGTVGMGTACAPSRSVTPLDALTTWLTPMLARGWTVVATDYAGLGTPGRQQYLVGEAEARDVVNSVRAARTIAQAGDAWVVYGHSQGGHSALWTGALAATLAPELRLLGVAAAAPAADLSDMISAQYAGPAGWAIGAEVVQSWPTVDPALPLKGIVSSAALRHGPALAARRLLVGGLEGLARSRFQGPFFVRDPMTDPVWAALAAAQTPGPLPASLPVLLVQSLGDELVAPWTNARLQQSWLAAGSDLAAIWLGKVGHGDTALVAGPAVVAWAADRFAGRPNVRSGTPPPIHPTPPA